MLVKSEGIVLQNFKYADKKSILKVFTKEYGLLTFFAAVSKSPNSKIKSASILPLYQVELSFVLKQNKDIQQLTESTITYVYENIGRDFNKLTLAQFLNEILVKSIKEHIPNQELFDFVIQTYKWLNESEGNHNNLHVYFLFELSKYLGFEPHNNYSLHNCYFDTREGRFTSNALSFPMGLNKAQSALFLKIFDNDILSLQISRTERADILECMLAFYKMHVSGFNDLKSIDVLKELFN